MLKARILGAVREREREREPHFSEIKCSLFSDSIFSIDSNKPIKE